MEEYKESLIKEYNELSERITKLDNTLKKRSQAKREKLNNNNTDRNEQDIKQA